MNSDPLKRLGDLESAVQQLFTHLEHLRQHVEALHIECAASTKRCSELQDEMTVLMKLLRDELKDDEAGT